jgi:hypothetical protein
MNDLSVDVALTWSVAGLQDAGQMQNDDVALDLSGPESMGGRGVGTDPEELLVCAVSSCYAAMAVRRAAPHAASGRLAGGRCQRHRDRLPGCYTRPRSWDTVATKFHRLAAARIDSGVPAQIVDAVRRLDEQDQLGIDELMRLVATPPTSDERSD